MAAHSGFSGGPPPSTLAAQLVENISTSAKTSRSDENFELKGLFATIKHVKDNPQALKSLPQRIEHNHMLVYVYCRVALEAIDLEDPFLDQGHVRTEVLKALNFLRFTIKETPIVLARTESNGLLLRGDEPLWMWLLPRVLRLLSHPKCQDLAGSIEGFLQYLFLVSVRAGALWGVIEPMAKYMRATITGLLDYLHSPSHTQNVNVRLPEDAVITQIIGRQATQTQYTVQSVPHALQQAPSLIGILAYPIISKDQAFSNASLLSDTSTWLLDTLIDLQSAQKRWAAPPTPVLDIIVNILESAPEGSLFTQKAYTVAVLLCNALVADPGPLTGTNDDESRSLFCKALLLIAKAATRYPPINRLVGSKLVNELSLLSSQLPAIGPDTDFARCMVILKQVTDASSDPVVPQIRDRDLAAVAHKLQLAERPTIHANKRQKRESEQDFDPFATACEIFDFGNPISEITQNLLTVSESKQCLAIDLVSRSFCLARSCNTCLQGIPDRRPANGDQERVLVLLIELVQLQPFLQSKRLRVATMIAIRRLALHCANDGFLSLETSELGQWCLQSLNSSVRELRIAAGRTLMVFLHDSKSEVIRRNRANTISLLKSVSDEMKPHLKESYIMVWGQLGRIVDEDELNLVLIKLLDFLGSSNSIVSAIAFNELLNLAEARGTTPRRLLEPYWRSLAYLTTKDMTRRPQTSRAIAELLQVSINELLVMIQTYALPWLVLDKRKDVIQKIVEARQETDAMLTFWDSQNLAAIMALLLSQDTEDMESFVASRLDETFQSLPLTQLLQSEPALIAMELLKSAGEADEQRKESIQRALHYMATVIMSSTKETRHKKTNMIGRFLQPHVLGLMARLTDVINDSTPQPQVLEQRRSIRALEEMIRVCKAYSRVARPQISACLLTALTQDPLREVAFSCWAAMIFSLEEEDVEALLETTFFIIGQYRGAMTGHTMKQATSVLNFITDQYRTSLMKYISKLPKLPHADEWTAIRHTIDKLKPQLQPEEELEVFAERISHDNPGVTYQGLVELVPYLRDNQTTLYASVTSQRPDAAIATLLRALLDCGSKYNGVRVDITRLCTESIGLVGCLDSNQIEAVREQRSIVILHNFANQTENIDFVLFLIQEVLVPSFLSATDTKLQGFLSFTMQELLDRTEIRGACEMHATGLTGSEPYEKWMGLPDHIREVATPFLTSKYMIAPMAHATLEYPIFRSGRTYWQWLRAFVMDLLRKGQNPLAQLLFEPLARAVRVKDPSTAEFILPYVFWHLLLGSGNATNVLNSLHDEVMAVLKFRPGEGASHQEKEDSKRFCQTVFRILDYGMRWIHAKRAGKPSSSEKEHIMIVQGFLDAVPPTVIAERALDCNDYARALFFLEQHTQNALQEGHAPDYRSRMLGKLQDIYANIDEPDGLDGISSHMHALDINQQILSHKKAGRWTAAQTWYELQLSETPGNVDVQMDLLNCLKQAGQHDVLLNHIAGMSADSSSDSKIMPFAVEAAWVTGRWDSLAKFTGRVPNSASQDFNISVGRLFESLHNKCDSASFEHRLESLREQIAAAMDASSTTSLQAAHDILLKSHVLTDLEMIVGAAGNETKQRSTLGVLDRRLQVIGAYFNDKQYILGIHRAAMKLARFTDSDISGVWLTSARLARKANSLHQSFNAVLHASKLGDDAATIENAKLLWRDDHHRQAIQVLQGAIERNRLTQASATASTAGTTGKLTSQQKLLTARAQLLLAKWLDTAGQTQASALREKYQQPPKTLSSWEKGYYYLGRYYKKILESQKPLSVDDQSDHYITGEMARLVIENYVRSLNSGTKYLYQTLPRVLTLWLDLGAQVDKAPEGKQSISRELHKRRLEQLNLLHSFLDKYIMRLPAYIFYTALPQIVARIAHPNVSVFERLTNIIIKVVETHPRQALWSLIGIITSRQKSERKNRGQQIIHALKSVTKKVDGGTDLKLLLRAGEKLAEQLLLACQNGDFGGNKTVYASLTRDLRFNQKCTPCPLAVPVESSLTATLPAVSELVRKHQAFSRDVVTIESFDDSVLVLSSLAKPRRLTARGSDGRKYMLLIKPKDDLRTDQRLMEFNGMINRSLKRDAESSRRQLYIRTYAVVPLNEECGIIEWVPGIKTIRDILLNLYHAAKVYPDYQQLRQLMEEAMGGENKLRIFTHDVLGRFPPMLHLWFIQQFPNPSAWFAARLKYTRSCAVMSMVGTILGLGDRHGENVNLEEGSGGVFHVDFNCLFDKGQTFARPEKVPFRLTHNMVAAMGVYGYEGPFRKSSELTLSILRQQQETLMTILEAFIYDPTLDLQKDKRSRSNNSSGVKLQPQSVVDSIKRKVTGLLPNESIPLSVEGQVEELIKQAVDPRNLTAMYIGWCPFL